ncbi:MAG: hypothetical protein ABW019_15995 [Chitinophagaceae bacterium]
MQFYKNTIRLVVLAGLVTAGYPVFAQDITKPDASDNYIQHRVMKKGQQFFFTSQNTTKRNALAQFEANDRSGEYPSFKLVYPAKKQEIIFFRSRHPLAIQPYTDYELSFTFKGQEGAGEGTVLELVVYDETRETQVESHPVTIPAGQPAWKEQTFSFTTLNKARFARLVIKSKPGADGDLLIGNIVLKQVSEPKAQQPAPVKIIGKTGWKLSAAAAFTSAPAELKTEKSYYAINFGMKWENFSGTIPVSVEWLTDKEGSRVIAVDKFEISSIDGLQPQWNGAQVEWKREARTSLDFMSLQLEKFFNQSKNGGAAHVVFRADKPEQARFVRIVTGENKEVKGLFEMQSMSIDAEY